MLGSLLEPQQQCWNSGSALLHAPPPLAARGFMRCRKQRQETVDLFRLLSFFLSSPTVKINVTCNQKKTHRQSVLVKFLDLFQSSFFSSTQFHCLLPSLFQAAARPRGHRRLGFCRWPIWQWWSSVAAARSLMTGGSVTDRLKEMTGLGWSVAVAVEETEGEEDAAEGKASVKGRWR